MKPRPCPFCGGKAEIWENGEWRIQCENYSLSHSVGLEAETKEKAIAKWNTRPSAWEEIEAIPVKYIEDEIQMCNNDERLQTYATAFTALIYTWRKMQSE